jgi:DNA-binding beta-propeller fold protein YncE
MAKRCRAYRVLRLSIYTLLIIPRVISITSCSGQRTAQEPVTQWESGLRFHYLLSFGGPGADAGQFFNSGGISIDAVGAVYVADTGNDRIQKFDPNGGFIASAGGFGSGVGEFNKPTDICARSGLRIYVADSQNRRIHELDFYLRDTAIYSITLSESGSSYTGTPIGIDLSRHGDLFVTDRENDRILHLRRTEQTFVEFRESSGNLRRPLGIAIGPDDNLYVCDTGNDRVAIFDPFMGMVGTIGEGILDAPEGIDIDERRTVYVADTRHHRVVIFNRHGEVIGTLGGPGNGPGQFDNPRDVAIYRGRFLYVLDSGNGRVQKFSIE